MEERFTHMLVSADTKQVAMGRVVYAGVAYMIGTLQECRVYQLQHGLRATTQIIPF